MHYAEYMPILSPPDEVNEQVKHFKSVCTDRIGDFKSRQSKAHITIPFDENRQKVFIAEPAIDRMEKRLNTIAPITLHINGFDIFPNHVSGNTIYAAFDMDDRTKNWFRLLLKEMQLSKRTLTPHLTIASGLTDNQLKEVWPYFMKQKFSIKFKVTEMLMLKRWIFEADSSWKVYKHIQFLNQLTTSTQINNPTLF